MKLKDIDLKKYDYKRIMLIKVNSMLFPAGREDVIMRLYGDDEVTEEPTVSESGWLTIVIERPIEKD
ncbi:MAG: hypothetical protein MJ101_02720 [Clostridia bacterium]|nr:hypothetical protein [Clostridia bacterium]